MNVDDRKLMYGWVVALVVALGLCAGAQAATRIKLATLAPKDTSFHQALLGMAEKWRAAPDPVQLTIFTNGTMGGEADMVKRMRVGQIQSAMLTVTGLTEIDDSVAALQNMPMIFRSLDEVEFVRSKLQPDLEKKFREKGFVVLFWSDAGWIRLWSRKAATMPDDFKAMKMFCWAGDNKAVDLWKASGYQPVPLETSDILTGLQTGLIDALGSPPTYALAGQFYGPAPHMLELNWAPLVGGTVITKAAWDKIPVASQQVMKQAAEEAGKQIQNRARTESDEAVAAMVKRGLTVHRPDAATEAAWRKESEAVYPKIRGSIVPPAMFDQVSQLLQDYRAKQVAKP